MNNLSSKLKSQNSPIDIRKQIQTPNRCKTADIHTPVTIQKNQKSLVFLSSVERPVLFYVNPRAVSFTGVCVNGDRIFSAPTEPSEPIVQQLKSEFQECSAQLEERHRQEIERLKSYYQQQMEETQERFTAEILLLQQRLQELTGAEELFR